VQEQRKTWKSHIFLQSTGIKDHKNESQDGAGTKKTEKKSKREREVWSRGYWAVLKDPYRAKKSDRDEPRLCNDEKKGWKIKRRGASTSLPKTQERGIATYEKRCR